MTRELPIIVTKRLIIRLATKEDIPEILKYYTDNHNYLARFHPLSSVEILTKQYWDNQLEADVWEFIHDYSLKLFIFRKIQPTIIIGNINFRNFIRSAAQFCTVGYSLAEAFQGNGYMTEALQASINYVFQELNMHRIMANYLPTNQRSGNLLKRLGFVIEGYARDYLLINGKWEDHILTSLVNSSWQG